MASQSFVFGKCSRGILQPLVSPVMIHSQSSFLPRPSGSCSFPYRQRIFTYIANGNPRARRHSRGIGFAYASGADDNSTNSIARWLLEPVGDGDSRHIGYQVQMPGSFEIISDVVTVGRLPERADLVIPVATVSARHAMLQKKGGSLVVTDLDSTNGTFIDQIKLRPGSSANVVPGSCIIFGDLHLAMFRVSKLEDVKTDNITADSEDSAESPIAAES